MKYIVYLVLFIIILRFFLRPYFISKIYKKTNINNLNPLNVIFYNRTLFKICNIKFEFTRYNLSIDENYLLLGLFTRFPIYNKLAKSFGKGNLFGFLMALFPTIFLGIIAFDDSKYVKLEQTNILSIIFHSLVYFLIIVIIIIAFMPIIIKIVNNLL